MSEEKNINIIPDEEMVDLPVEESEEEIAQTLLEQDSLDGETPAQFEEQLFEEADEQSEMIVKMSAQLKKSQLMVKILSACVAGLALAFLVSLGMLASIMWQQPTQEVFEGLVVGKDYTSNLAIADYSAMTYANTYVAPTENDVMAEIRSDMVGTDYELKKDVTDKLQSGDSVTINFDGYVDGKIYDSACADNYELALGSNKFIPGFEDGLIGHTVGEKVTLNLTFPSDYSATELQGKDVRFEVEITAATRTAYAELSESVVSGLTEGKYSSVEEYKESVRAELDDAARADAEKAAKNELWNTLADGSTLKKYPDNMYEHFVKRLDGQFSSYYSSYGVSDLEGFMNANGMKLEDYIEGQIIYEYAIYTIAAQQGIVLEDADYASMMEQYKCNTKEELASYIGVEIWELESSVLYDKVSDFLYKNATVK